VLEEVPQSAVGESASASCLSSRDTELGDDGEDGDSTREAECAVGVECVETLFLLNRGDAI
jgi:hypothetical protein